MSVLRFTAPPLPHFISCGRDVAEPGRKHLERYAIGEFDLLVVKRGCLYIGEEERKYELAEGQALVLRPDLHHYPTEGNREETEMFWLHFHTLGDWRGEDEAEHDAQPEGTAMPLRSFRLETFALRLPQYANLVQPAKAYRLLEELCDLQLHAHLEQNRWRQQLLFQELLLLLGDSLGSGPAKPGAEVAEKAASYLRQHYREAVTANDLGAALSFHPVYVARCMQRAFGCSPMEYLNRFRLEQAKSLLLQTDLPIGDVAEETGFRQAAYFSACFREWTGMSPREYRQRHIGKKQQ